VLLHDCATVPQRIEIGNSVIAAHRGIAINQERLRPDRARGLDDGWTAIGPIIPPRVNSRTRAPSRPTISLKPSCLIS
jgi:hypothetical protein